MFKAYVDNRVIEFEYFSVGPCISGGSILWLKDKGHRIIEGFKLGGQDGYSMDDKCDGLVHLSRIA